ncbi:hypothetical protein QUB16_17740 [Microcoleus sp. D3_18a_C4]
MPVLDWQFLRCLLAITLFARAYRSRAGGICHGKQWLCMDERYSMKICK